MSNNIDTDLYSRQIYVMGKEAMEKITKSSVLISGMDELGTEVAKCLVLGGIKKVLIHDNHNINQKDLSSSYYFSENDVGKNKASTILDKLRELNPYVEINISKNFQKDSIECELVIMCNYDNHSLDDIIIINKNLRSHGKKTIACSTLGMLGQIFCDFGENFSVLDTDGEEVKTGTITKIELTKDDKILIETASDHNLARDDIINIKEKNNILNTSVLKVLTSTKFIVDKSDFFSENIKNKLVIETTFEQVKNTITLNYDDLETCLDKYDKVVSFDAYNPEHTSFCHNLFLNHHYPEKYKLTPQNKNQEELYQKFNSSKNGNFCPIQSVIGSIVAQESMKAISGKFTPINQFLYFDELKLAEVNPNVDMSSRYYGQEVIFGSELQKKITDSKIFIVGAGAIGCEHLKNFSMMGVGNMVITDMDTIEKSNLNRQFLFRNHDIGKFKSEVAGREAMKMNPNIKVEVHKNKVGEDTEVIYNQDFFNSLTCVANALDNVSARLFVDSLCIKNKKALLESGTLGAKGNVQTIVPHLTETYGSQVDPPEKGFAVCTLKNFPYQIEHTIQYARDNFEGMFVKIPEKVNTYLDKKEKYLDTLTLLELEEFYQDLKELRENMPTCLEDCIKYSHNKWYKLFNHQIRDLIKQYPEDDVNDMGQKFWSGTKKFPQYKNWDYNNEDDIMFILSNTILRSFMCNIDIGQFDKSQIIDVIVKMLKDKVIDFNQSEKKIGSSEEEQKKIDEARLNSLDRTELDIKINELASTITKKLQINEFEKDNDSNYHIDFVHSFSNLRADNYRIPIVDRLATKKIAGKIIPAIATTTSLVSGLVAIEFIKIIKKYNKLEDYRNYFINLALPLFTFSEPGPVQVNSLANGKIKFTLWDSFDFKDMELQELFDYFEKNYNINISMVNHGQKMLYSGFMNPKKAEDRKNMKISAILREIYGKELEDKVIEITLVGENPEQEDEEIELPVCKFYL